MSLMFALKILTDLCYYLFAVNSLASCAPHTGLLLTSPLFVTLAAYLASRVTEKWPKNMWLRALAVLVSCGAFFFTKTAADKVVTVPMILYLGFVAFRRQMIADYDSTLARFFLCLKIIPAPAVLTIIAANKTGFMEVMLPYLVFFLILSVMLLRMLRHNELVYHDHRFRIINFLEIAALCGFGYLLSTGYVLKFLKWLGMLIANYVLSPIFTGVVYVFGGFAWVLNKIFSGIDFHLEDVDLSQLQIGTPIDPADKAILEYYEEEAGKSTAANVITYILIGLACIVLVALVIVLFRVLMRASHRDEDNEFADVRESLDKSELRGNDRLTRSPRDRVRHVYRKFLKQAYKEGGLDEEENYDSREIADLVTRRYRSEALEGLRDVYIRARYSTEEISGDDVKQAKAMFDGLKAKDEG